MRPAYGHYRLMLRATDTPIPTLGHASDIGAALRAIDLWHDGSMGIHALDRRLAEHLVDARRLHPVGKSDRAFCRRDQLSGSMACSPGAIDEALARLAARRLVERCGTTAGDMRWRATEHAVLGLQVERSLQR